MAEERLRNTKAPTTGADESRDERRDDRAFDDREHSHEKLADDPTGMEEELMEFLDDRLPKLPKIPGFHPIWLSTTNQYDTITNRERMGYTPVRPQDLPEGFKHLTVSNKAGSTEELITCNEMVAYKIPLEKYLRIMQHLHHNRPLQDEQSIRAGLDERVVDERGNSLIRDIGDGTAEIGKPRKASFQ